MPAPATRVERSDLVRGFEVSKNKYVLLDKDELDAVKLESTRIIDIEEFVDADAIDRIYWDEPYYLAPRGKTGIEAFAVIQAAMKKQGKVALGRLVLHQRERPCALEPRDGGILLTTLAHATTRSAAATACSTATCPSPTRACCRSPRRSSPSRRPSSIRRHFKDRYEDALRELIARKKKGEKPVDRRGARGRGREGRRPDGGPEEEPQGRRRSVARQGRPFPGGAGPQGQAEGEEEGVDAQARGLAVP